VRVGIVCRYGLCPGAAHMLEPVASPTSSAPKSASISVTIPRFITLSLDSIVPCTLGVSRPGGL
jgi:hypothetical protein